MTRFLNKIFFLIIPFMFFIPSFAFASSPTVNTLPIGGSYTQTTATFNGSVTNVGGLPVSTVIGFYYGTSGSYNLTSATTSVLSSAPSPSTTIGPTTVSGLICNTPYNFIAFASNTYGTSTLVGGVSFTTSPCTIPTISNSTSVISITATTAVISGNITSLGGTANATVGFKYGTSMSYGLTASSSATSSGSFSETITGLSCNHTYHYQVFPK